MRPGVMRGSRSRTRYHAALALGAAGLLAGCEQPLRPAVSPAPLEAAAERTGAAPAEIARLQHIMRQLQYSPAPAAAVPDTLSPEVAELRRTLRLLEQSYRTP
jgi:hypothetical protein